MLIPESEDPGGETPTEARVEGWGDVPQADAVACRP